VTQEHAEAFDEVTRLRERLGLDKGILQGHPYPVTMIRSMPRLMLASPWPKPK